MHPQLTALQPLARLAKKRSQHTPLANDERSTSMRTDGLRRADVEPERPPTALVARVSPGKSRVPDFPAPAGGGVLDRLMGLHLTASTVERSWDRAESDWRRKAPYAEANAKQRSALLGSSIPTIAPFKCCAPRSTP